MTPPKVGRVPDSARRLRTLEPPLGAPRTVMLADPRVAQPSFQRSYLVPSYATSKKDAEALEVLSHILGSGSTSRLYRALVVDQRVATNTGAYYQGASLDASRFGVYAGPQPGVTFKTAETAPAEVIADNRKSGVARDAL